MKDLDKLEPLVQTIPVNTYSADKRTLFFLNHTENSTYDALADGPLKLHFNLILLRYDLLICASAPDAAIQIFNQLSDVIVKEQNCLVIGYSIHGFIAHQLSCVFPNIAFCVLLDTFNYFEYDKMSARRAGFKVFSYIYSNLKKNRDYGYLWFLIKKYSPKPKRKTNPRKVIFRESVNVIIDHLNYGQTLQSCIYFKASRSLTDFGLSWKNYVKGDFHHHTFIGSHGDIHKKYAIKMADYIVKASNGYVS